MFEKILISLFVGSLLISLAMFCYYEFKNYNKDNNDEKSEV